MNVDEIPGWFDFHALYCRAARRIPDGGHAIEIGCWLGKSIAFLAQELKTNGKNVTLYGVDHGYGSDAPEDAHLFQEELDRNGGNVTGCLLSNLRACGLEDRVMIVPYAGERVAPLVEDGTIDFIFLDGDHRKESVERDLKLWWPKIKPGGAMAGHDYWWDGVGTAVKAFFGRDVPDDDCPHCWWVKK